MRVPPSVWFLILSGLVAVLFHLKYEVQALEKRLTGLNQAIEKDRNAIQLLEAEWTYLNRPERLARLATRYLPLKNPPITAWHLAQFAKLRQRFGILGMRVTNRI